MRIFLHICCAPCSVMVIKKLREQNHDVTGYWYNPNIHPYMEYKVRKEALEGYATDIGLDLVENDVYGLRMFVEHVAKDLNNRCMFCYEERIRQTAIEAKKRGFDAFSSTLLISPYQKHALLVEIADRIGKEEGIPFYYEDFRPFFYEGRKIAKELPLYMQKYCGCVFSEEERYLGEKKKKNN